MLSGDIAFLNKRAARGKFNQQGRFPYHNTLRRPRIAQLRLYERLWRQDVSLKLALLSRTLWLTNTIGEIEHPDPEIAEFHNNSIKLLENEGGRSWADCLQDMLQTMYWSGFSVSEVLYDLKFGALSLQDVITYHPSTLVIYTDKKGRLVEGKKSIDHYHKSGIWQMGTGVDVMEKQLSMWKHIYLSHDAGYGNYYGFSILEPSYVWVRLKEALIDMMAAGLDKLGQRAMWVRMPSYSTGETRYNPASQEEENISSLRLVMEQFEAAEGIPEVVFLPYQQEGHKPELGSESLQDELGDVFLQAIDYADSQAIKHIIPPYLLTTSLDTQNDPVIRERQIEIFSNNIEAERKRLTNALIQKIFLPLQQWNFNRESAKQPPTFARVYSDRTEDRLATMQIVKGLIESAVLNPANDIDYTKIMQMLRLGSRKRDKKDIQFIKDMLIEPRRKNNPRDRDKGPQGSGNPGRSVGSKEKQIEDRLTQSS